MSNLSARLTSEELDALGIPYGSDRATNLDELKKQILEQIEKQKLDDLPQNLIEQEVQILSQGMKEDELN